MYGELPILEVLPNLVPTQSVVLFPDFLYGVSLDAVMSPVIGTVARVVCPGSAEEKAVPGDVES